MDKVRHYINNDGKLIVTPVKGIPENNGVYLEFLLSEFVDAYDTLNFSEKPSSYTYMLPKDGLYRYCRLHIPRRSELVEYNEETNTTTEHLKGKVYWDDMTYVFAKTTYEEEEFVLDENGDKIVESERITFKKDPVTGSYVLDYREVQKLDDLGRPTVSDTGEPVMETVYTYVPIVERTYKTQMVTKTKITKTSIPGTEEIIFNKLVNGGVYKDFIVGEVDDSDHISLETLMVDANRTNMGLLRHSYIYDEDDIYPAPPNTVIPVSIFCIAYLDKCLIELERQLLQEKGKFLNNDCVPSVTNKSKDFVLLARIAIERYILDHDYEKAQEIIDFITTCGAPCSLNTDPTGCGCAK